MPDMSADKTVVLMIIACVAVVQRLVGTSFHRFTIMAVGTSLNSGPFAINVCRISVDEWRLRQNKI
jgi:hypothetical protein